MSATCDIEFENNPRKIVYAGQLLRGTARLNLPENVNILAVYIRIKGKGYASWNHGKTKIVAKEQYFDEKTYLVGAKNDKIFDLTPGLHDYPFEFQLPSAVPSSFEGEIGHIKYTIRVVIEVPRWMNKVFKEQFTLIKAFNLNDHPVLRQPLILEEFCKVCPLGLDCFDSSQMHIVARMPVSGFLPGQTVNLQIDVNNQSDVAISQFTIALIKSIAYAKDYNFCGCKSKYKKEEEKSLFTKTNDGCNALDDKTIHITAEIPPTIPTEFSMSEIIKISYLIRIKALTPLLYKNAIVNLPIMVGSYPFEESFFEH